MRHIVLCKGEILKRIFQTVPNFGRQIICAVLITFGCSYSYSQILVFAKADRKVQPMTAGLMSFVAETLHVGKLAINLNCGVKVREIKQERKFSDGVRIVEMLEIVFQSSLFHSPEQKAYFPIGSVITREIKVSAFSGTVEEIQIESDDLANSRFTFQHNGLGELIWMSFENDLTTLPCRMR